MLTVLLLIVSNVFMVIAWYGHLKFKETPLLSVIFISWGIAFSNIASKSPRIDTVTANSLRLNSK